MEDAPPADLFVDDEEDAALGFMPTCEPVRHAPAPQVPRLVMPGHSFPAPGVPLGRPCEAQIEQLVSARLQGALSPRRGSPRRGSPRKPGLGSGKPAGKPAPPNPYPGDKTAQLFEEIMQSASLEALLATVGTGLSCSCEPEMGGDELMFPVSLLDNAEFVSLSGEGSYKEQQLPKDGFDDIISEPLSPRRRPWQGAWWLNDLPKDENMRLKRQTELWSALTSDSLRTHSARLLGGPEQSQSLKVRSGKPPAPAAPLFLDERPEEHPADAGADVREDAEALDCAAGPQPEASRPQPEVQTESGPAPPAAKAVSEAQDGGGFMSSVSSWFSSAFGASGAASPEQEPAQAADEQSPRESLNEAWNEAGSGTGSGADAANHPAQHGAEEPAEEEPAVAPVTPRGKRRGAGAQDGKSVLGPSSAMSSSAASLLMGVQAKKKTARGGAGEAKSVLGGSTAMTSSAAGALAGALAAPKKRGNADAEAKSVLGGSTAMTSSAAGALGTLALGRRKKSPRPDADAEGDQEAAPASEADSRTPTPARANTGRKDDGKSVLAASSLGMNSSAASALSSALGTKKGASRPSPRAEEEEEEEEAATAAAPAPKKRSASRKRLDGKSVISGMNATSSSSAGALLGSLVKKGR